MTREYQRAKFYDRFYDIHLRLTGRQKNEIITYAKKIDASVNQVILFAVWDFIRKSKGIPSPGTAQYSPPTVSDVIGAYVAGVTLLKPCGQKECEQKLTELSGMVFCTTCNYRVS